MICKIAELVVDVPAAGGLASRCKEYLIEDKETTDVVVRTELYRREKYDPSIKENTIAYMESAYQFYQALVRFDGFYIHASAVVRDGKAYLFSGPCRAGKSTHAGLWKKTFGPDTYIINDDKPALRRIDGIWYAYGTPWCGKDGINKNEKVPLAGLCFLKKAQENKIRRLEAEEAIKKILSQTIYKFDDIVSLDSLLCSLDLFLKEIPVYELENVPLPSAALLSYETMRLDIQEV